MTLLFAGLFVMFCLVVGLAAGSAWRAFIIMTLWNWFMPALFGLPYLNVWQALGLSLVALATCPMNLSQNNSSIDKKNVMETLSKNSMNGLLVVFFYGLILLGIGYVAHCMLLAQ